MQSSLRILRPLFILFILLNAAFLFSTSLLAKYNVDRDLLLGANFFLLILTLISFSIQRRGMLDKNPHVFVRSITGGMLIKMVLCIIAIIIYVYASGESFNKRGIFFSLLLYLVYLFVEVKLVMRMNKKQHA